MNDRTPPLAARVSYQALRDYLAARRWQGMPSRLSYAAIYRSPGAGEVEVQIPLDPDLADYADAITLAARRISSFEGRPSEQVLRDLLQQRLAFASSPETREVVGAVAQKAVDHLFNKGAEKTATGDARQLADGPSLGVETWAYNGTEYTIEHQTTSNASGPCVTAWIRDYRDGTEGFGEDLDQALDACKNAAAIVFADLEPGEAPPAGPPATAKKSKGPKLKGHDQAAVLAAVARTDSTIEAALELGCVPEQLKKFAEKHGLDLKVDVPPAPQEKAGKTRGRRKAGAK